MKSDRSGASIDMTVNPEALLKATIKTYEKVIVKVTEGDKSFNFSESWVKTLNSEDGSKLEEAIEKITAKKK